MLVRRYLLLEYILYDLDGAIIIEPPWPYVILSRLVNFGRTTWNDRKMGTTEQSRSRCGSIMQPQVQV